MALFATRHLRMKLGAAGKDLGTQCRSVLEAHMFSTSSEIVVIPVSEKLQEAVLNHVTPIFMRDEPLSKCFPPCRTGRRERQFREYAVEQLRSGLCLAALQGQNVVGACLNRSLSREAVMMDSKPPPEEVEEEDDPLISNVVKMLKTVHRKLDLFSFLGVEELFEVGLISVEPTHVGKGLGLRLARASLELAAKSSFRAAKADATGPASTRVLQRSGMETVYSLSYETYKVNDQVVFKTNETKALTVLAARLTDCPPYVLPPTAK